MMVEEQIEARGVKDPRVLRAMHRVPRERFVPGEYRWQAHEDHPLPIGHGQTISQPYIVAYMTELLELGPKDKILEVGTGSGYQAAVLSEITSQVFTIETIEALYQSARRNLVEYGFPEERIRRGNGYYGWPEEAPFDGIIVTAASREIPPPLQEQLRAGGRLVIPLGSASGIQELVRVRKDERAEIEVEPGLPVRFVPLTA
jgi:protein-L-isoaspartate(D-aspartate) O-methyltransferase